MHPLAGVLLQALTGVLVPLHAGPGDDIEPLVGWRYVTGWTWSSGAGIPLLISAAIYLWGVWVLHRRGDTWLPYRTFSFVVLGLGSSAWALMGPLGTYDTVLFWVHMVQHMILTMITPVFIAQGAPVTLALRTLPPRPHGWLLRLVHSWLAKVLLFPPLATAFMVMTPFALYLSGLYEFTLRNDWAHDLMHVWMLWIGVSFFIPILGIDPVPLKMPYPMRLILIFLTMPFHAFLGTTIMGSTRLIAEDWYVAFLRPWGPSPQDDQYWAGALMWATGDLTMLTTMSALVAVWYKDSVREARRIDRALDREDALAARAEARMRADQASAADASGYDAGEHETTGREDT